MNEILSHFIFRLFLTRSLHTKNLGTCYLGNNSSSLCPESIMV